MIDLHSHILPGIDDGSKSLETTLEMLQNAAANAVDVIVATSHYSPEADQRYDQVFAEVAQRAADFNITLLPGMEYDYDRLSEVRPEAIRGVGNTNWVLIDLKQPYLASGANELIFNLRLRGKEILVAHPERLFGQRYRENINKLTGEFALQINSGSILGCYGKEAAMAALDILSNYPCCLIAGDAHRPTHYRFPECEAKMRRFFPAEIVEVWMRENPRRLLAGEKLQSVQVSPSCWRRLRWKLDLIINPARH